MKRTLWSGATILAAAITATAMWGARAPAGASVPASLPAPADTTPSSTGPDTAVFSGGCFWGVQAVFQRVKGVEVATAGYAGGTAATATYALSSTGRTKQAESVRVIYDPSRVTYGTLLRLFFSVVHDPTEKNRQGPDVGPQYRSAIWTTSDRQASEARTYIARLSRDGVFSRPIVTEVQPLPAFYPAETYHQDYLLHHPDQPYIAINDLPKVRALRRDFPELWRDRPAPWMMDPESSTH
jgi:peptide-methionine (S)-S-oxide reductase